MMWLPHVDYARSKVTIDDTAYFPTRHDRRLLENHQKDTLHSATGTDA